MINQILQRSKRLFKVFPRKSKAHRRLLCSNIGSTGFTGKKGTFSKEISRSKSLIYKLTISKSNIMYFHTSILHNIKHLANISFIDNLVPLIELQSRKCIGNLDQHGIIFQIRQKLDLLQHIHRILLLRGIIIRQHITKSPLIDLPQFTLRIGNTGRGTRTIIQQGQFPKGCPARTRPDVVPIDCKADMSILHDVEVIPDIPLLDNDRTCLDTIGLHGIN
mmetsp:Transcript_27060/g.43928  ORF Transcript_27060/g.43928 Transcript_27060/m.43928 type:complete len:220 (-) Transcript_27060:446-1105(-)